MDYSARAGFAATVFGSAECLPPTTHDSLREASLPLGQTPVGRDFPRPSSLSTNRNDETDDPLAAENTRLASAFSRPTKKRKKQSAPRSKRFRRRRRLRQRRLLPHPGKCESRSARSQKLPERSISSATSQVLAPMRAKDSSISVAARNQSVTTPTSPVLRESSRHTAGETLPPACRSSARSARF